MDKDEATKKVLDFIDAHTQIEKLAEYIPSDILSCEGQPKGLHLYREQRRDIARGILEQGLVVLTREEYERNR